MTRDGNPRDLMTAVDAARVLDLSAVMVRLLAHKRQLTTAVTTVRGARLLRGEDIERLAEVHRNEESGSRNA